LGYASPDTQNGSSVWVPCLGTLLEAIGIVLETHFGFGFPNGSPLGDSLIGNKAHWASYRVQSASENSNSTRIDVRLE